MTKRLVVLFLLCTLTATMRADFTNVTPNYVINVGPYLFTGNTGSPGLTSITISAVVTNIEPDSFLNCFYLREINVDPSNVDYSSVDGILFNKSKTILIQFPRRKAISHYIVPDSVTSIGDGAFAYCRLTNIILGTSITNIGKAAFTDCASLSRINIPNSVTSIGSQAFVMCTNLANLTLGNSVTNIGEAAFAVCTSLTSINIPNGVTSIGSEAFVMCTNLASVTLGNSITNIGKAAFALCTKLAKITIGKNVTRIGDNAFSGCTNLKGVFFKGNAPHLASSDFSSATNSTIYNLPGTTGWGSAFGGRPTAEWKP